MRSYIYACFNFETVKNKFDKLVPSYGYSVAFLKIIILLYITCSYT